MSVTLPREAGCGRAARVWLNERLEDEVHPLVLADAKLVVSELVNNAYEHGTGAIGLRLQRLDDRLRLEVVDEGAGASVHVREASVSGGGRGLRIVQALSNDWGVFGGTTHVWVELDTSSADRKSDPL